MRDTAATEDRTVAETPAIVVGNSIGGGLAVRIAVEHPDLVRALVLIAPSPSAYPYESWPTSTAEAEQDLRIEAAERSGDLDLVNRLEIRYWLDGTEQPEGRVGGDARILMAEMNSTALRAEPVGEKREGTPVWSRIAEVEVPTFVVVGEHDLPGVHQQCAELVAALPNARLETMWNTAHCPSLDQPVSLSEKVLDFLDTIER